MLRIYLALVLALALNSELFAQERGMIRGLVTDPNGAVIPNALVTVKRLSERADAGASINTDSNGEFTLTNLPLGTFEISVRVSFIHRNFTRRVELTGSVPTQADVTMSLAPCFDEKEATKEVEMPQADRIAITKNLIGLVIGDSQRRREKKLIFSPENFDIRWLSPHHQSQLSVMNRVEIQDLTESGGSLTYYSITKPVKRGSCVSVAVLTNLTVKGQIENANMAGGEDVFEFRKIDGKWVGLLLFSAIS
ncbi:MAG: carboxypeptidase-like regulatory domain-containing protein [Blastocatellia bacterium]